MKNKLFKLFCILSLLLVPLIGQADWVFKEKYIETPGYTVPKENAVCIGCDGGGMYYSSIEDALDHANARASLSHQKVIVIPGVNTTIKRSCKVASNVTLYIPYDKKYGSDYLGPINPNSYQLNRENHDSKTYVVKENGKNVTKEYINSKTGPIDINESQAKTFNSTKITLAPGVHLTIEHGPSTQDYGGRIILGGEYGEKGVNGYHAAIYLSKNSKILNYGNFECYGYIKESIKETVKEENDTREVVTKNGTLITPMGLYGITYEGSTLDKLVNSKPAVCPINAFDFPCIQTKNTVYANGNFLGCIHLARTIAGDQYVVEKQKIRIIDSDLSKKALFNTPAGCENIKNPFKIEFNYINNHSLNPSIAEKKLGYLFSYPSASLNKEVYLEINIYNKVELGSFKITFGGSISIDTADMYLPLSYRHKINIKEGAYFYAANKIKLMPGSILKIEKNANLDLRSQLIALDKEAIKSMDNLGYPKGFDDAYIINNGSLVTISGSNIGGKIITEDTTGEASLNFINTPNINGLYCTSIEGKLKKEVTRQVEGVTTFNDKSIPCFFRHNKSYRSIENASIPGWVIDEDDIPKKLTIDVAETETDKVVYSYDIIKSKKLIGTNIVDKHREIYIAPFENCKVNIKRTTNFIEQNFAKDSNQNIKLNNDNGRILITPAPARYINIIEDDAGITSFSGRGTVVTEIEESLVNEDAKFYPIAKFGSTCKNLKIADKKFFRINTDYGYWTYDKETQWFGEGDKDTFVPHANSDSTPRDFSKRNHSVQYVEGDVKIVRYGGSGSCFKKGTPILMSDLTYKNVEDVTQDDLVMAFNHEKGKLEPTKLLAVVDHGITKNKSIKLNFDNNKSLTFIDSHEIFNMDKMKYEEINTYNVRNKVNENYAYLKNSKFNKSKLVNYEINEYKDNAYTLVSYKNLNIIANDMLTFTPNLKGLVDYFSYNNDLSYNLDLMNEDINKYGLYTYDDWKDKISYSMYEGYNFKYFKVSIGKGLMAYNDLLRYIDYSNKLISNGEMNNY